jgi:osmotically-inducible protein OsmY
MRGWRRVLLALALASRFRAAFPVLVAGAAGGAALVATDRRTAGAQVDDEGIELKVVTQAENLYGDRAHVNATSYNGLVLLTGEVPDQGAWTSLGNFAKAQAKVKPCRTSSSSRRRRTCRSARTTPTSRPR